jgi:hypothetical protein
LLVLLVNVYLRKGKALGSEKGKGLGCGLCYEQRREVEHGALLRMVRINFDIN